MQQLNAELKKHMKTLRISEAAGILDTLLMKAEKKGFTYQEFLYKLQHEVKRRDEKSMERRLNRAAFPNTRRLKSLI